MSVAMPTGLPAGASIMTHAGQGVPVQHAMSLGAVRPAFGIQQRKAIRLFFFLFFSVFPQCSAPFTKMASKEWSAVSKPWF